jgi:tripartite-type tricarboxylate transporter receptor subunit TctC
LDRRAVLALVAQVALWRAAAAQPVVVDNRPGAAGMLGTGQVQQAAADGYTLLLSLPSAQITAPLLMDKPAFDGTTDFTPIGRFARFTAVLLVNDTVPAKDFASFIAYGRERPGKLNYASAGNGSNPHLAMELVKLQKRLHLVHIPYKGGAPALQALLAGEVQAMFGETTTALPWIRSGRLTPLAVVADKRLPLLPGVPTLGEAGVIDAPTDAWMALAGPRGLPQAVVRRLSQALESAVSQPEFRQLMASGGGEASWSSPEALQALWVGDRRRWAVVVRANGIRAD